MTEVKSLKVTDSTYRHRGWMWADRGVYELFKPYMKLPLWVDRILTNHSGTDLYAVGKTDGFNNTVLLGPIHTALLNIPESFPEGRARHNCRVHPNNGFRVLAERIRAKKPDANKVPRPQWRRTMRKPWEPGTLGGNWLIDSSFVKEVCLDIPTPPTWADRLWVSTSAGTDTFVWVNSKAKGYGHGGELHAARHAKGIVGHQVSGGFEPDSVVCNSGCHWQLAGVRKKTVQVPVSMVVQAHVVVKPEPDVPMTATAVRAAYDQAKERLFRDLYTPQPAVILNYEYLERMVMAYCVRDVLGTPKPPIGVKPRNLHDEERANALDEAMVRHLNEDLPFPIEWAVEWNELRARLNKEQK